MHLQSLNCDFKDPQLQRKFQEKVKTQRRKRQLLDKFEACFQATQDHLSSTWDFEATEENLTSHWNQLPNDFMVGVLHAFILLRPQLKKCLKNTKHTESAIAFFEARRTQNPGLQTPILSRTDSLQLLNLASKSEHEIVPKMKEIFVKVDECLAILGQSMPPPKAN